MIVRGFAKTPAGDGAPGFWHALEEVFPATHRQRCWGRKTANVLTKLPKKQPPQTKSMIHEIDLSATREDAQKAYADFIDLHEAKYPKATACLSRDYEDLFAFYDFPAERWAIFALPTRSNPPSPP